MLPIFALVTYGLGILTTILFNSRAISKYKHSAFTPTIISPLRLGITAPVPIPTPFTSAAVAASKSQNVSEITEWHYLAGLCVLIFVLIGASGFFYYLCVQHLLQKGSSQGDLQDIFLQYDWEKKKLEDSKLSTPSTVTNHEALDSTKQDNQHNPQNGSSQHTLTAQARPLNNSTQALVIYDKRRIAQLDNGKSQLQDKAVIKDLDKDKAQLVKDKADLTSQLNKAKADRATVQLAQAEYISKNYYLQNENMELSQHKENNIAEIAKLNSEIRQLKEKCQHKSTELWNLSQDNIDLGRQYQDRESVYAAEKQKLVEDLRTAKKEADLSEEFAEGKEGIILQLEKTVDLLRKLNTQLMTEPKESPVDLQEATSDIHPRTARNRKKRDNRKSKKRGQANGQVTQGDAANDESGDEEADGKENAEDCKTNEGSGEVGDKGVDTVKE